MLDVEYEKNRSCLCGVTLLEAEVLLDADSKENQKSQMKAIAFPLMDDPDALPSSYITKVLTCVSKWSCKLQKLTEGAGPDVTPNASMDAFLSSIQFFHLPLWTSVCCNVTKQPRLSQKALAIDKELTGLTDKLTQVQTKGIVDGYKRK